MTKTEEGEYLLLLSQKGKSFKPLSDKFKELGAFYNGIGYAFPVEKEIFLRQIVKELPNVNIVKVPLGGQTFEFLRQTQKSTYLREELYKIEKEIAELCLKTSLDTDISLEELENINLPQSQKDLITELINEMI